MSLQGRLIEHVLKLPPAVTRDITVTRDLRIPAYDGVDLLADLYSPRWVPNAPTVLVRTPYSRKGMLSRMICWPFAERGYQVLIATVRGTDGSGGEFDPFRHETADGLATLDWLEKQSWHNGKVLLYGPSYLGHVQLAMAPEAGDRITALVPMITSSAFRDNWYPGGSFELAALLAWTARMAALQRGHPLLADVGELVGDKRARAAMSHLPVAEADVVATGKRAGFFQDWLGASEPVHPYWGAERQHRERIGEITAPTLLFAAWQDILLPGQLADYAAMRAVGRTPYLTIGPWLHVDTEVMAEATREALVWFRAHVTGDTSTLRAQPVRLYVQGADEWRDYPDWPPAGFTDETWYLQPHNRLALQPPQDGVTGRFTYDPADPTPTVGGPLLDPRTGGRKDNAGLEARPDVLVYTSDPLTEPVEVIGPVSALIRLHISAEHADVVVRLCDVDPDGRSTNVCDGIQRTTPEEADGTVVHLWPTAYRFDRGHRLRVQVCGGSFPRFPRGTADPHATQLHAVDYEILDGSHIVLKRSEFLQREVSMWGRLVRRLGMTDTMSEPISTTNLDRYGHAELPWSRPRDILVTDPGKSHLTFFVGTVRPDGRPHSAGVGAIWVDDALYFVGGPETRRSRNLAANPACTVSATLRGIDLVLEGDAHRVTDVSTLEQIAAVYRTSGWPAEVEGAAFTAPFSAPSAGPAPWYLYRLTLHTAFGVANAEPHGATRWDFAH